jgi:hypothetical protein
VKRRRKEGPSAGSRPALLAALIERAGLRRAPGPPEQEDPAPSDSSPARVEPPVREQQAAPQPPPRPRRALARAVQRSAKPQPQAEPAVPPAREWNLWELERLAREQAGNEARDEEWTALFTHHRVFASADGVLPKEFDHLVRESFGRLIEAA